MNRNEKSYKVNEVAKLLNTNEETVRRWIRNNKLHATQQSKKIGNIISSDDLQTFFQEYPKYLDRFMTSTGSAAEKTTVNVLAGLSLSLLGVAGISAIKMLLAKESFSQEDIVSFAKQQIAKIDNRIRQKRSAIAELEEEISDYQSQIDNYQKILEMGGEELEQAIKTLKNTGR